MPRRAEPAQAGRWSWIWIAAVVVLMVPGAAGARVPRPVLAASLGGTFAVTGTPSEGGSSFSLSLLWPVAERVSFGVMLSGDDAGSSVDSLRNAQGTTLSYGKIEQIHRAAWGASWRLDVAAPSWHRVAPFASGSWGLYQVRDDLHGTKVADATSTGFSVGGGLRSRVGGHLSLAAVVRYHRLFNELEGRFMSAGLEGSWR